jgi:hypothetical protein
MMRAATITLAAILTTSATFGGCLGGEATKAGIYMLHSAAQGTCPALDWHVVLKVDGTVAGMISWDEMRSMAQVMGVVKNEDRTFHLQAREFGGDMRTAVIDGFIKDDESLLMNIKGPDINCPSVTVPRVTMPDAD